MGSIYSISRRK